MLLGEAAGLVCFQIQHSDDPVLHDQRNGQLRAHVGRAGDVLRMLGHIVHQDGLAALRRLSGDALANLDLHPLCNFARISHLEADSQLLRLFIHQQDGEDFVFNNPTDQFGHPAQGGVQVQGGVDDVRHLKQQRLDFQLVGLGRSGFHRFGFKELQ